MNRAVVAHEHRLWIDRVSSRLRLSPWGGAAVLGLALYALFIGLYAVGVSADLADIVIYGLVFYLPLVVGPLAASLYVRDKMVDLEAYAMRMAEDPDAASDPLAPLSHLGPVALIGAGMFLAFLLPYFLQPGALGEASGQLGLVLTLIPWLFAIWTAATGLWILGFSLLGVYRIGKLPMRLLPFTQDRSLGLKPFASTCLRLTGIYYLLVSYTLISDLDAPLPLWYAVARGLVFLVLGIPLFVLPLLSLHEKLVRVKAEKSAWINARYSRIVEGFEARADGPMDPQIQGELLATAKIRMDVHAIRPWPFDVSALAKLITIFLSVTAILLSRVLASFFRI